MKQSEDQRVEQIIKAARKCFMEKGFHSTSMRAIAKEADMSLGNIYRYFKDKDHLIKSFVDSDEKEILEAFELLKTRMGFKLILKEILKEYIKELGERSEAALHIEFMAEGLRNEEVFKIISKTATTCDNKLIEIFEEQAKNKKFKFQLGPANTAITVLRSVEGYAYDTILKPDFSRLKATELTNKLVDHLIVGE